QAARGGRGGGTARAAALAKEGPPQGRQAGGALGGDRLPSVTQLPQLVAGFRRDTGTNVSLVIEGAPRPLPAEADLALYRGAQEALTNIARYAPGATAAVTVRYQPGHTTLTVQNGACPSSGGPAATARDGGPLAGAGGGHGLPAMRARAERAGGTARGGPHGGGWLVELDVPV